MMCRYTFSAANAEDLFRRFFGSANPYFSDFFSDAHSFGAGFGFGETGKARGPMQGRDVEREVYCTLEELYNGCVAVWGCAWCQKMRRKKGF
jgi:DnaJ-class molecular chaperone